MSEPLKNDFAIIGFPKCGTSALLRLLGSHPKIHLMAGPGAVETTRGRDIELPLFVGRTELPDGFGRPEVVNGHKYSAYIFSRRALDNLLRHNGKSIIIVCTRHPMKSLISWHNMHRKIASEGAPGHFTTRTPEDRDFYMNCSLQEYYDRYAENNLRYDFFVKRAFKVFPEQQVVVVAQERLARDPVSPVARVVELLGLAPLEASTSEVKPHFGHADRVKETAGVSPDLAAKLDATHASMLSVIEATGHASNVFV